MKKLVFVPGSLRAASASVATARAFIERIGSGATCEIADIGVLPHYNADVANDPAVAAWIAQLAAADGVVLITPEYNYSIPGVLKNALDWASRPAFESVFKGKPCFVMSLSGGGLGGVRAQADLKYILNGMLARTYVSKEIVIPMANNKIVDGKLDDPLILDFAGDALQGFIAGL